jgi:CheY-like chemotaxis protein/MinD-like ATPase involved in chromosome partitioning or flagellar assembly
MAEKILIIDDDLDTLRLVGLMLQKQGYQIPAAGDGQQGLELAFNDTPDLILLDVMMPVMDGYEVARRLRANQNTAGVPILMFSAKSQLDDKVTGFEAGADDYLTKPTHPTELQAHVKALLARSSKAKTSTLSAPSIPTGQAAYMIGIIAARGGLGVTTVALNLAAMLRAKSNTGVILAEFRPGQGVLAADLRLSKENGLNELLNMPNTEITAHAVRDRLAVHSSGIDFLVASPQPRDGVLINNIQQFEMIYNRLSTMTRFGVLDLGVGINPLSLRLLPKLNEIFVVTEPFDNSLLHSRALLDDLIALDIDKQRLRVVINYRLRSESQLSVNQVQDRVKHPVEVTFTPAPELLLQAVRLQSPAVLIQADSLTAQQFQTLANKIEARAPKPPKPAQK